MMRNLMEENSKLRSSKPAQAPQPQVKQSKAEPTLKTIKEESAPVIPVRPKHVCKGIKSRWDKYK